MPSTDAPLRAKNLCLIFIITSAFFLLRSPSVVEGANDSYYQNGRWHTINNTGYYLRVDEWRQIQGRCYRLLSDNSVQVRSACPNR